MDAFGIIVVFVIAWWLSFFVALPFGIRPIENPEPGHAPGAPQRLPVLLQYARKAVGVAVGLAVDAVGVQQHFVRRGKTGKPVEFLEGAEAAEIVRMGHVFPVLRTHAHHALVVEVIQEVVRGLVRTREDRQQAASVPHRRCRFKAEQVGDRRPHADVHRHGAGHPARRDDRGPARDQGNPVAAVPRGALAAPEAPGPAFEERASHPGVE